MRPFNVDRDAGDTGLLGFGRVIRPAEARDFFVPQRFNLALVSAMKSDRHLIDEIHL